MTTDRFLRLSQIVPHMIPISKSSWWQGVRKGIYPQPQKLSPRCTVWRLSDITRLIEDKFKGEVE